MRVDFNHIVPPLNEQLDDVFEVFLLAYDEIHFVSAGLRLCRQLRMNSEQ